MAWTADDAIVYPGSTDRQGFDQTSVNRVDSDGTHDTQLASVGNAEVFDAAVSPDGTRVAYIHDTDLLTMDTSGRNVVEVSVPPSFLLEGVQWSADGKRLLLTSIDGVVSIAASPTPAAPPVVYASGDFSVPDGLDLENTWSDVTWQPVTGPTK